MKNSKNIACGGQKTRKIPKLWFQIGVPFGHKTESAHLGRSLGSCLSLRRRGPGRSLLRACRRNQHGKFNYYEYFPNLRGFFSKLQPAKKMKKWKFRLENLFPRELITVWGSAGLCCCCGSIWASAAGAGVGA